MEWIYLYISGILRIFIIASEKFEPGTDALSSGLYLLFMVRSPTNRYSQCTIIIRKEEMIMLKRILADLIAPQFRRALLVGCQKGTVDLSKIEKERASVPGSNGSVTVEAALAVPIFFFAVVCLIYLFEIRAIQFSVRNAAQNAAKTAAVDLAVFPVFNPWKLERDIVKLIGAERMDQSVIEGGSGGLNCWFSYYQEDEGLLTATVRYKVRLPFTQFLNVTLSLKESFQIKAWTGYYRPGMAENGDSIVYITDYGTVYHEDARCPHLQLSVRYVPAAEVEALRNLDGGIYYACGDCVYSESMSGVYITDYGIKYHHSLECSGLKRTVRAVKKSEIKGRRQCSRCGEAK